MEIGYAQILGFIATCMEYNSFVVQLISNPEIIKLEKIALNLNLPKSVGPTKPSSHGYQHRKFLGIEEFAHSIRRTTEFNVFWMHMSHTVTSVMGVVESTLWKVPNF